MKKEKVRERRRKKDDETTTPASAGNASGSGEQEFVRGVVMEATGVTFDVVAPHPGFPLPIEKVEWFMRCRNRDEIAKAPYLNTVWKETRVGIWLESLAVGDTIDWIELAYGEERAGESVNIDYSSFDDPSFRADFQTKFPIVLGRIKEYEAVVAGVSPTKKNGKGDVDLELRHAGSKGMLVFTVAARVSAPTRMSREALKATLRTGVAALKEAYDAISRL